ncbi:IS481 family transposase, partial [Alkalilimnicola sp. S0819]
HIPQKALGHKAPIQAMREWQKRRPDLFVKEIRNHPGPDS